MDKLKYGKLKGIQKLPTASSKNKISKYNHTTKTVNLDINDENLERWLNFLFNLKYLNVIDFN